MSNDLIEQMRRHVASYKTLTRHRQACLDMCDLIESQAKEVSQLRAMLNRAGWDDEVIAITLGEPQ